jgi:prepilin-type N-terminal cleavage/methylation domain-containing protein
MRDGMAAGALRTASRGSAGARMPSWNSVPGLCGSRAHERGRAGFTLLEVTICMAILAVALSGTIAAILVTTQMNTQAEAEMLATAATEQALAQVRQTPFDNLYADYVNPGNPAKRYFTIDGLAPPATGVAHGEVILILDETPDESTYGQPLAVGDPAAGVDLNANGSTTDSLGGGFGVDIDGDGVVDADPIPPAELQLIPVVVLVRWRSGEGIQRFQVMTMVVARQ